jgi:hypothetical protein
MLTGTFPFYPIQPMSFTDTVTITFSQTPIETTDFVNMTNQVLSTCTSQYNKINYSGDKYFYLVHLKPLSSNATSATVIIHSIFGSKYNGTNDLTPIGQWPKSVFPNVDLAFSDYLTCDDLVNHQVANQKQAPFWLEYYINQYKSYLNYDPYYDNSNGDPNPNITLVIGNVMELEGSSQYIYYDNKHIYVNNPPMYPANYFDTLLHLPNPLDDFPGDCNKDFNCWKFSNLSGFNNTPISCTVSAPNKCLGKAELDYYFDRLMSIILETKTKYNRDQFISIYNFGGIGKCVESFCSDWWYMTISIGNGYSVQTKPEDKLTFPNPIN